MTRGESLDAAKRKFEEAKNAILALREEGKVERVKRDISKLKEDLEASLEALNQPPDPFLAAAKAYVAGRLTLQGLKAQWAKALMLSPDRDIASAARSMVQEKGKKQ